MGISCLFQILNDDYSHQRNLHYFRGKTIGIDAMCWMHRGAVSCAQELVEGKYSEKFLKFFLKMVALCLDNQITPIIVFDGSDLPMKHSENNERRERRKSNRQSAIELLEKRRRGQRIDSRELYQKCISAISITQEMKERVMTALHELNVAYLVAPYESDAQLGYLYRTNVIDAVISEDSDILVFGTDILITKLDMAGNAIVYDLSDTSKGVLNQIDRHLEFTDICILSGCDYVPSEHHVKGCGLKTCLKMFKKHGGGLSLEKLNEQGFFKSTESYLTHLRSRIAFLLHYVVDLRHLNESTHHEKNTVVNHLNQKYLHLFNEYKSMSQSTNLHDIIGNRYDDIVMSKILTGAAMVNHSGDVINEDKNRVAYTPLPKDDRRTIMSIRNSSRKKEEKEKDNSNNNKIDSDLRLLTKVVSKRKFDDEFCDFLKENTTSNHSKNHHELKQVNLKNHIRKLEENAREKAKIPKLFTPNQWG